MKILVFNLLSLIIIRKNGPSTININIDYTCIINDIRYNMTSILCVVNLFL